MWSIHMLDYYSAVKRGEFLTHTTGWMNLENIMLSERRHTESPQFYNSVYMKCPELVNPQRQKVAWCLPGAG